jgi:hypothetical protein
VPTETQVDAYIATCSEEELNAFREMVATKREVHAKFLGPIIRRTNPRTNPDIRAFIAAQLPPSGDAPRLSEADLRLEEERNASDLRMQIEREILSSTSPDEIRAALDAVMLKMPGSSIDHWAKHGIHPMDVPSVRSKVAALILK